MMDAREADDRRQTGEAIYIDGQEMRVGDLVEVAPTSIRYDGPKWAIGEQGDIQSIGVTRIRIKVRDDGRECTIRPADLSLITRYE